MANPNITLLYQAMASPLGLVLSVSDFTQASQALYKARRDTQDPDLAVLQFRRSPFSPDTEIWLVKGGKKPEVDGSSSVAAAAPPKEKEDGESSSSA